MAKLKPTTAKRSKPKPAAPRKPPTQTLAPTTEPAEPGDSGPQIIFIARNPAGILVTEDTALTLGAVFACIRVIAEDIAGLPHHVYARRADGGRTIQTTHPVDSLLYFRANIETPAYFWRETTIAHAISWGNGYSEIERDMADRPAAIWQLTPDRVEPQRFKGRIVYDVKNGNAPNTVLEAEDVLHVRGLGFDGLVGYSVISLASRAIGLGMSLEETAATFSGNDSTPGGVLSMPGKLSDDAAKRLADTWQQRHGGPKNRRKVAVLEQGLTWQATGLPPEDSQLIEQRQFTPAEICRWFRVKPHKIADLSRATFSNIESESTDHVNDTLMPWARRLESECDVKLFSEKERGRLFTKLNFEGRLRGDSAARLAFYGGMFDRGAFSINDILGLEDRNPIGPDGDKRFVMVNMQLLENAGEVPEVAPKPEPEPEKEPEEDTETTPEDKKLAVDALRPIVQDVCGRIARRADHRVRDALKRLDGKPAEFGKWLEEFVAEHGIYASESMQPVAESAATMLKLNGNTAKELTAAFVSAHVDRIMRDSEIFISGASGVTSDADNFLAAIARGK